MDITEKNMIAERIKTARMETGKNISQFARDCGMMPQNYQKYESNTRTPNVFAIVRIARAAGVTTDYLLGMDDKEGSHGTGTEKTAETLIIEPRAADLVYVKLKK